MKNTSFDLLINCERCNNKLQGHTSDNEHSNCSTCYPNINVKNVIDSKCCLNCGMLYEKETRGISVKNRAVILK